MPLALTVASSRHMHVFGLSLVPVQHWTLEPMNAAAVNISHSCHSSVLAVRVRMAERRLVNT